MKRDLILSALFFPALLFTVAAFGQSPIYGVSTPGGQFAYNVTNVPANTVSTFNPTLNLTAGATYRLFIDAASFHPVAIVTNTSGNFLNPPVNFGYSNASPQGIFSGTVTLTIPATNYPSTLFYQCNVHSFFGQINVLPPPPPGQIASIVVTTNVVLTTVGATNTWLFVPEFNSNIVSGAWSPVPAYSTLVSPNQAGATITFDRLDPICGSNVFLRVRQSPPN